MRFPSGDPQRDFFMAKLTDQLEKRLLELKQWYARKKQEERQYGQGLQQHQPPPPMVGQSHTYITTV